MLCDFANVGDFKEHMDLGSSKRWTPCGFARSKSSESIAVGSLTFVAPRLPVPTASVVW